MTDIAVEDVQRLADLADRLAEIRRNVRHTARRPPAKVPDLLARNIADLTGYIATAAALRAELSHRPGPRVANSGESWGPAFAATRATDALQRMTVLLNRACDLSNQTRPRSTVGFHFYSPGLEQRVAAGFAEIDDMLSHTIRTIRDTRSGLARVRKRELEREQEALAEPSGKAARHLAEPHGPAAEVAVAAKAAGRRGATLIVSSPPAAGPASSTTQAAPAARR
ncbi:hypothetical protein ACFV4P_31215 [Kitasatospora sp. NPDC059795]|uniref:hypothetical protein n=1 Tax=Kitasatospora sp. NPDC059795 TaxID=3346949 RepID=UPI00365C677A